MTITHLLHLALNMMLEDAWAHVICSMCSCVLALRAASYSPKLLCLSSFNAFCTEMTGVCWLQVRLLYLHAEKREVALATETDQTLSEARTHAQVGVGVLCLCGRAL